MILSELIGNHESNTLITEGINDNNIFKAIFVCGAPGSGKNYVIRQLGLEHIGFKNIDVDDVLVRLRRTRPEMEYELAHVVKDRRRDIWINNYLGLCINGTGREAEHILPLKSRLEDSGYETSMIMVTVPLDIAIARAKKRDEISNGGRNTTLDFIISAHEGVEKFKVTYKNTFEYYTEVKNEGHIDTELVKARRMLREFLNQPLSSKANEIIVSNHGQSKNRY